LRKGRRIVYSPYLSGVSNLDWDALPARDEVAAFRRANEELMPDCRFYPSSLGLAPSNAYQLISK
jgi:hypothetical protein